MSYLRGIRMDRGTALAANDANGSFATASEKASMFNDAIKVSYAASVFNEAAFTTANKALVFNEAAFTTANKALVCREAGLSIANINAIIIHANITDDNAQQILSEITKANRDLTSAANIYEILDDWDDNKLTGRDGAGTTSTGFTNLFAHKDKFRPEWTTVTGSPSAAGGKLVLDVQYEEVSTPSTFTVGTWEADRLGTLSGDTGLYFIIMHNGGTYEQNSYFMRLVYPENRIDFNYQTTQLIVTAYTWDTANHTWKTTRDGSGNFEIFIDGVSKGTVLNTTLTTSASMGFVMHYAGGYHSIDNLKVY